MARSDFSTTAKAVMAAIPVAGRAYTGELNTPEMYAHLRAAQDAALAKHGWTPEDWTVELAAQREASRAAMLDRIARMKAEEST